MDDHTADASGDPSREAPHEPVGTLGEEAVKLLAAASAWAREQQPRAQRFQAGQSAEQDGSRASCGSEPTEAPCSWCPICQAVTSVRSASPEPGAAVRTWLASLTDLARVVRDSLAEHQQRNQRHGRAPRGDDGEDAWD